MRRLVRRTERFGVGGNIPLLGEIFNCDKTRLMHRITMKMCRCVQFTLSRALCESTPREIAYSGAAGFDLTTPFLWRPRRRFQGTDSSSSKARFKARRPVPWTVTGECAFRRETIIMLKRTRQLNRPPQEQASPVQLNTDIVESRICRSY